MLTTKRILAGGAALLLLPALLFMISLLLRGMGAPQSEPARAAGQIVDWYAGRIWTLWLLLALARCVHLAAAASHCMAKGRLRAGDRL